jgi:hypothetical protein
MLSSLRLSRLDRQRRSLSPYYFTPAPEARRVSGSSSRNAGTGVLIEGVEPSRT